MKCLKRFFWDAKVKAWWFCVFLRKTMLHQRLKPLASQTNSSNHALTYCVRICLNFVLFPFEISAKFSDLQCVKCEFHLFGMMNFRGKLDNDVNQFLKKIEPFIFISLLVYWWLSAAPQERMGHKILCLYAF